MNNKQVRVKSYKRSLPNSSFDKGPGYRPYVKEVYVKGHKRSKPNR
ncbi:MAG: hypothetical protein GY754_12685 [bacterium]|nr:hypothetical protein [bacterium]